MLDLLAWVLLFGPGDPFLKPDVSAWVRSSPPSVRQVIEVKARETGLLKDESPSQEYFDGFVNVMRHRAQGKKLPQ